MQLSFLDLKLLIAFDAVMAERNITRAAKRLGVSQPSLSKALARLRDVLDDRLFIRSADGMKPTPRALEIAVPVADALRKLQSTIEKQRFVPAEANHTFRLAMAPHSATILLPPLIQRLEKVAPNVRIRVVPRDNARIVTMLDANEIDFVIGFSPDLPRRFSQVELMRDEFVCVMRKGHSLSKGKMTLERFTGVKHVLITASGEENSLFDDNLRAAGYRRPINLIVNEYLAGLLVIERTNLVTGMFRRVLDIVQRSADFGIVSRPLPIAPRPIRLDWHDGLTNHPAYDWLRDEIIQICKELSSSPRDR